MNGLWEALSNNERPFIVFPLPDPPKKKEKRESIPISHVKNGYFAGNNIQENHGTFRIIRASPRHFGLKANAATKMGHFIYIYIYKLIFIFI